MSYKNDLLLCNLPAIVNATYSAATLSDAALVKSATDRKTNTFSAHASYWADLSALNTVNFVYVKSKNVATIQIYDGVTRVANIDASTFSVTTEQGETSDWQADGYQNFLIALDLHAGTEYRTTSLLKLDFTGIGREIYEIACLYSKDSIKAETDGVLPKDQAKFTQLNFTPHLRT